MRDTGAKQYLAYDKGKRKFFSLDEVELEDTDLELEIYEFDEQNFRLVTR
jgi:hypothetical protein